MNYRDKLQKFSIRKYAVGTFSTLIATLVFLGTHTDRAHASENTNAAVEKAQQILNPKHPETKIVIQMMQ